jgi:hypothetical protein
VTGRRRPPGILVLDLLRFYRRHFVVLLAAVLGFEVVVTLLQMPLLIAAAETLPAGSLPDTGGATGAATGPPLLAGLTAGGPAGLGLAVLAATVGAFALVGVMGAVVAIELQARRGAEPTVSAAYRALRLRQAPLLRAGTALAVASAAATLLDALWWAPTLDDPGLAGGALVGELGASIVLLVGGIYLALRWAVAVPILMSEGVGLREALRRSSDLTRGARLYAAGVLLLALLVAAAIWIALSLVPESLWLLRPDAFTLGPLAALTALQVLAASLMAPLLPLAMARLRSELVGAGGDAAGR